jgi:hypothetical protein
MTPHRTQHRTLDHLSGQTAAHTPRYPALFLVISTAVLHTTIPLVIETCEFIPLSL